MLRKGMLVAIMLVIAFGLYACSSSPETAAPTQSPVTTPSTKPELTSNAPLPSPVKECLELPVEISMKIFNDQLTELQKEELWKEYKGEKVSWTCTLKEVVSAEQYLVAIFEGGYGSILAFFDEAERPKLAKLSIGDFVAFEGTLDRYDYPKMSESVIEPLQKFWGASALKLIDCTIVTPRVQLVSLWKTTLNPWGNMMLIDKTLYIDYQGLHPTFIALDIKTGRTIWSRDTLKTLGFDYRDIDIYGTLLGADDDRLYLLRGRMFTLTTEGNGEYNLVIEALDKDTGETVLVKQTKAWYEERKPANIQSILENNGIKITFYPGLGAKKVEFDDIVFENRGYLLAIDSTTQRNLWSKQFPSIIKCLALTEDILCVISERSIEAFRVESFN